MNIATERNGDVMTFTRQSLEGMLVGLVLVLVPSGLRGATTPPNPPDADVVGLADESVVNLWCPVWTDEKTDPEIWLEFEGRKVYFCCERCRRKFKRDPARYRQGLASVLALASQAATGVNGGADGQPAPDQATPPVQDEHGEHGHPQEGNGPTQEGGHDHDHGEHSRNLIGHTVAWLGKLHPMVVHFPIAMLIAAAFAEVMSLVTGRYFFAHAARFCAIFGGLSALVAGLLGWFFGGFRLVDADWIMTTHRWVGTAAVIWAVLVAALTFAVHRGATGRWETCYRLTLFVGAGLVSAAGFFGGALVYGLDHFAW